MTVRRADVVRGWLLTEGLVTAVLATGLVTGAAIADEVTITADRDNTMFSPGTSNSSGGGPLFAGRTNSSGGGTRQRALVHFDVAGLVPAGATIVAARVELALSQAGPTSGDQLLTLQRLLGDWGEGTSSAFGGRGAPATPGDATWTHTFFPDAFWASEGGDFAEDVSTSAVVGTVTGYYVWASTSTTVADVQGWLDAPASNFGWMLRGNEGMLGSAKKFASREFGDPLFAPRLVVEYEASTECAGDTDGSGEVDFDDLLQVLFDWGPCRGCAGDVNGSGAVDGADLQIVLSTWGPC